MLDLVDDSFKVTIVDMLKKKKLSEIYWKKLKEDLMTVDWKH